MKSTKTFLIFELCTDRCCLRNEIIMTVLGKSLANCFRVFIFLSEMLHCVSALDCHETPIIFPPLTAVEFASGVLVGKAPRRENLESSDNYFCFRINHTRLNN